MRKFLLLSLICLIPLLSGCTDKNGRELQGMNEGDLEFITRTGAKDKLVCIDGIEYIYFRSGYAASMAPHLKTDKFNNPKVITCEVKNEN